MASGPFCAEQEKRKLSFPQGKGLGRWKVETPHTSPYLLSVLGGQVSRGFHGGLGDPKTHNKHKTESEGDGGGLHES